MNTIRKKIYALSFVLLGALLFLGGAFFKDSIHLAPQSMFVREEAAEPVVFVERYLADLESLRDYLAKGQQQEIERILETFPAGFKAYRFESEEEVKRLLKAIVAVFDYAAGGEADSLPVFDTYIKWLEKMFPGIFKVVNENEMDFATEGLFQVLTLLTENVFQHGEGECILIIGATETQHYFSLVSKGEFKSVKGAMIKQELPGAVRGEASVNGVALSEALSWYLSEFNDFIRTYYPKKTKEGFDVLITGRDGKYSYRGLLAEQGYSAHVHDKGGATATFSMGKEKTPDLKEFLRLIIDSEYMFLSAA